MTWAWSAALSASAVRGRGLPPALASGSLTTPSREVSQHEAGQPSGGFRVQLPLPVSLFFAADRLVQCFARVFFRTPPSSGAQEVVRAFRLPSSISS